MKNNAIKTFAALLLALVLMLTIIPEVKAETYTAGDNCVNLIARFESCRLTAYKCPAGVWTIGYGHTKGVKEGMTLSGEAEARKLLKEDLASYAGSVNKCIGNGTIGFEMNQNRFDALVAFTFNCGAGNLEKLVKGQTAETVATKILGYNKGGGRVLPSLTARRQAERELFLK